MLRFFRQIRQIPFEPPIKQIIGLTQMFSYLSCRALPRHLQSAIEELDYLDVSPSMGLGIEMTKLRSA